MKIITSIKNRAITLLTLLLLILIPNKIINAQQKIGFGIHADPVVSWFSSDINEVKNDGARPGFSFGLTFNRYFTPNYSFSTGISIISSGGRLVSSDTTDLLLGDLTLKIATVLPEKPVLYKIQYLSVPLGLKLQTNQIGYLTFFTDLGIDPKVVVAGKADIPSLGISGEKTPSELKYFNLSYHVTAGIEYSLGGNTAVVLGLRYDNNFLDATKENGDQPVDKIAHKMLSFRIGMNF